MYTSIYKNDAKHQANGRQHSSFVGLCVSLQCVCLALPVAGGGRAQCVIGFERSAALTF